MSIERGEHVDDAVRAARRGRRAEVDGEDFGRALLDRGLDVEAGDDAGVDVPLVADAHRGEKAGDGAGGEHGVDDRAAGEDALDASAERGGGDVEGDFGGADFVDGDERGDQVAQELVGVEAHAAAEEVAADGEEVAVPHFEVAQGAPDGRELVDVVGVVGEVRAVERADAGADDQVGADAEVHEALEEGDLTDAGVAAAAEDQGEPALGHAWGSSPVWALG